MRYLVSSYRTTNMQLQMGTRSIYLSLVILISTVAIQASVRTEHGNDAVLRAYKDGLTKVMYIPHPDNALPFGTLIAWKFYAYRVGTISLQVWRYTGTSTFYTLVDQTDVIVDSVGAQTVYPDYFTVKEGDVIGLYFPKYNLIPFSSCDYDESTLLYAVKPTAESLQPGKLSYFNRLKNDKKWVPCRMYSLKAVVVEGFKLYGNPVIERSDLDSLENTVVIPEPLRTMSYAVLQGWRFYAKRLGLIYLQVWRRAGAKMKYQLVSHTKYLVRKTGVQLVDAEKFDTVSDDDVIGFYFPGKNVIPYDGMKCPIDKGMYIYKPSHLGLKIGQSYTFRTNPKALMKCRRYSLLALTLPVQPGRMVFGHETVNRKLTDISSNIMFIPNPNKKMTGGTLRSWKIYSGRKGVVYLQVWRPSGNMKYQLVSNTKYEVKYPGVEHTDASQRLYIKSGDVIGFYTPEDSIIPFDGSECSTSNAGLYYDHPNPKQITIGSVHTFQKIPNGWKPCRMYSIETVLSIN